MKESELRQKLLECAHTLRERAFALSDTLYAAPECSGEEYESSAAIVRLLRERGLTVEYPFAGQETAFRARINPEKELRAALLAEYDALPGLGHACGHCASGAASVLAALALHELRGELDFGVDLIGTPDEELHGGKAMMANAGVFDGYAFAAMAHMGAETTAEVNFIALDCLDIRFHGRAAHAAGAPEQGRNALNAARLFFDAADMLRQHITPAARIHGYMKNGGSASNIVPDFAEVEFLTRAPQRAVLDDITDWVRDCARAAALATRTEAEITPVGESFHELHVSESEKALLCECFAELGLAYSAAGDGMVGSSDIGNVDSVCPAFHPIVGIGAPLACHTAAFAAAMPTEAAHTAIENAAGVLLTLCTKIFCDRERLAALQKEHREYRGK